MMPCAFKVSINSYTKSPKGKYSSRSYLRSSRATVTKVLPYYALFIILSYLTTDMHVFTLFGLNRKYNEWPGLAKFHIYCRTAKFHVLVILTNLTNEKNSLK